MSNCPVYLAELANDPQPVTSIFTDNVDEYDVPLYNASEYKPEKHELELAKQQREAEELKIELMVNRFFKTGSFV